MTSREREPNSELATANLIAFDRPVTGQLGRRRSKTEGDRDLFEVKGSAGRQLISIELAGIPNVDLALMVMGRDGRPRAIVDEGGVGEGEHLFRRAIEGPAFIAVDSLLAEGQAVPTENVSDDYTLLVRREALDAGWEHEPNASQADATELVPGRELRGHLESRGDIDVLRWTGEDAMVAVDVHGDGIPLSWQTTDGQSHPAGVTRVRLRKGEQLRLARLDQGAHKGGLPGLAAAWSITATPQ